jgi:hypothetical protein
MISIKSKIALTAVVLLPSLCAAMPLTLMPGWNLAGNGSSVEINVSSLMGDKSKITSVWKWNKTKNIWAFYTPSLDAATLATYAASKGYEVLDTILPKEGYWVNSTYSGSINDTTAIPPVIGSTSPALQEADLIFGWNLVANSNNINPSQLNTVMRQNLGAAGKAIITAWSWDASNSKWRFYATSLESQGGTSLADYIKSKDYLPYSIASTSTDGFWLNVGVGSPVATSPALALDSAKAFMNTMRSNIKALSATDISLQTELQATSDELKNKLAPIATSNINALRVVHDAIIFWNDVVKNPSTPFTATLPLYTSGYNYAGAPPSGTCTLYLDPNYTTVAFAKDEAKYISCEIGDAYNDIIPATDSNGYIKDCNLPGDWCYTQWSTRIRINPDALNLDKFNVFTQTRESVFTLPATTGMPYDETRTNYGAAFPGNVAVLLITRDASGSIIGVNMQGELSPAYTITNNWYSFYDPILNTWYGKPNTKVTIYGDKHNIAINENLSHPVPGVDKYSFYGSTELIKNGLSESYLNLLDGSYFQSSSNSIALFQNSNLPIQDGSHEMLLKLNGGTSMIQYSGDLKLASFSPDVSLTQYKPRTLQFLGAVSRYGVPFLNGSISIESQNYEHFNETLPPSNINYFNTHSSIMGSISIPTRLPLNFSLVSNQLNSGYGFLSTMDSSGQFTQGSLIVNLSSYDKLNVKVTTLQSTDGVQLNIDKSQLYYTITYNGALQGVYNTITGEISYVDGTYEIY